MISERQYDSCVVGRNVIITEDVKKCDFLSSIRVKSSAAVVNVLTITILNINVVHRSRITQQQFIIFSLISWSQLLQSLLRKTIEKKKN